ncbi:hypothetical protein HYU92_00945 [Candidatus Curtissbacteria bacterium]|nr:hypothetical protein [Candidatus Curtissbacteria bacterium]
MPAQLTLNAQRLTTIALIVASYLLFSIFSSRQGTGLLLNAVFAGSGLVSTIGGVTFVQGANQFWVTSARPTFSGITTAGAAVSGTVGSQSVAATADSSGNWSWTPASDLSGDNTVTITSGSTTTAFTLTIGQLPESIATSGAAGLAPAGSISPTLAFLAGGFVLILIGSFALAKSFSKPQ